jgi:hypothetical protein
VVVGTLKVSGRLATPPELGTNSVLTLRPLVVANLSDGKIATVAVKCVNYLPHPFPCCLLSAFVAQMVQLDDE